MLQSINAHPRDQFIEFEEKNHIYTVHGELGYTSVTTWNHRHFHEFDADAIIKGILKNARWKKDPTYKYYGRSSEDIKADWETNRVSASTMGTKLHNDIEDFYNAKEVHNSSVEYGYFNQFWTEFQLQFPTLRPYRTEWMVFHEELKISGSIDMIFENTEDGTIWIYDWKRSKEISYESCFKNSFAKTPCVSHFPDTNFWHYTLQLNMYRAILEQKYGKRVSKMCLVCLHPDNPTKTYELFEVNPLYQEMDDLFQVRMGELAAAAKKKEDDHFQNELKEHKDE